MQKVTPQEIEIIKRIAAIQGIKHVVEKRYNCETDQEEDCDCFYATCRSGDFEWCAKWNSFDEFISDYAQFQYDKGYSAS